MGYRKDWAYPSHRKKSWWSWKSWWGTGQSEAGGDGFAHQQSSNQPGEQVLQTEHKNIMDLFTRAINSGDVKAQEIIAEKRETVTLDFAKRIRPEPKAYHTDAGTPFIAGSTFTGTRLA